MPTYRYLCGRCETGFDVIKSMSMLDEPEKCPECSKVCDSTSRQLSRVNFNGAADWNSQCWSPALGKVVRNHRHERAEAKARGMEELGTEKPETVHKHFEKKREETREQRWADADRVKVYE